MKIVEAVKLVKALHEIKNQSLPIKTAHSVVMLLRDLEPHVHFYVEKEKEIIGKYSDNLSQDGKFTIKQSDLSDFTKEKQELDDVDIEVEVPQFTLPAEISLTPSAMNALLDYVRIED